MTEIFRRNHVKVEGDGELTLVFAHGFGCDQNMWRLLAPQYTSRFRTVTFDHVGSGRSDLGAYDRKKYNSLAGYASDVNEILEEVTDGRVVFVGHSVSAMIGMLADLRCPGKIIGHMMIGPSPCYVNDGEYVGGFTGEDIDSLLDTLEANYLGWAGSMAPVIMGAPEQPDLSLELSDSFCRTDPEIAKQFARVTFTADNRLDLPRLHTPTLIVQSSDDFIAPMAVGEYLRDHLPHAMLRVVENSGHCPHLSAPCASADAMNEFLASIKV